MHYYVLECCLFSAEITSLVKRASENPVQMLEEEVDAETRSLSREICSTSVYHQADQILRRIVSKEMSAAKGIDSLGLFKKTSKLSALLYNLLRNYFKIKSPLVG